MTIRRCRLLRSAHPLTIRLPATLWRRLRAHARKNGNSLNYQIAEFIETGLLDLPTNAPQVPMEQLPWLTED